MTINDDNVIEGMQMDDDDDNKIMVFGTDVSKIPCYKDSLLTGIYGGFGCGIASFLATSRALRSTNVSVISFGIITIGYWLNCRQKWAHDYFNMKQAEDSFAEEIESIKERKKAKKPSGELLVEPNQ